MAFAAVAGASAANGWLQQLVLDVRDSWDQSVHSQRLLPGMRLQQQQQQVVLPAENGLQQQQEEVVVLASENAMKDSAVQQQPPLPADTLADIPITAAANAAAQATLQRVQFVTQLKLDFGQSVAVLGSCSSLGEWQASRAVRLQWSEGNKWSGTAELPAG
jgi:hypothetical protein